MRSLKIIRIDGGQRQARDDLITEEVSLGLLAGHRRLAVLMCSPQDLEDLVRGFLYTSGMIESSGQIRRVLINRATWTAFIELAPEIDPDSLSLSSVIGSACGSAPAAAGSAAPSAVNPAAPEEGTEKGRDGTPEKAPDEAPAYPPRTGETTLPGRDTSLSVPSGSISAFMEELRKRSQIHRRTGGVHAAALAAVSGLLVFREDIGRHNAVDKVIGACLLQGVPFADKILLSSGRLSSEIIHKAARCGLPIVVSRGAPTDRSVALARERGITLIGFARGDRMNLYSIPERVKT
jgi:FdhD protein